MVDQNQESKPIEEGKKDGEENAGGFTSSAEAKMVMYVVPVIIVLVVVALFLSKCSAGG